MNKMIKISLAISGMFLASMLGIHAQNSSDLTTEYTTTQIDEMLKKHEMSQTQNTYPSQELKNKFLMDFPKAKDVDWEKSEFLYEVEFEIGRIIDKDYKAYYDMAGKLVAYKEEISTRDIPGIVKNAALAKYPNYRFEDADKIVKGKAVFYKVELEKGDMEVKLVLDDNGTIVHEMLD